MSRATPDDQLKFLLNCVKHSNNGKIDFVEVAKECGIVSKGAAAKRYERLMKANGIHPNGGPSDKPPTSASSPKERSKAGVGKAAAVKKRKIGGDLPSHLKDDDEDDNLFLPPKLERDEHQQIKPEPERAACTMSSMSYGTLPPLGQGTVPRNNFTFNFEGQNMHPAPLMTDGDTLFDEFCNTDLFSTPLPDNPPQKKSSQVLRTSLPVLSNSSDILMPEAVVETPCETPVSSCVGDRNPEPILIGD